MGQRSTAVVDPMPREATGSCERALGPAVDVHGQRKRGPYKGRLPLDEGSTSYPAGGGQAGATARCLHEADPSVANFGYALEIRELHRLEFVMQAGDPDRRRTHQPTALIPTVGDVSRRIDLYEGTQLIGEPKAVGDAERLQVQVL